MNRRLLLKGATGLSGLAGLAYLQPALSASDVVEYIDYTPEVFEQAVASGEPFMLDFYASW
ncbi:MAG: hypothetical protein WA888_21170 [Burkholderiaceae bacterium]